MFCIIHMAINAAQYWTLHIIGDYMQLLNQPWYHMISRDVHLCPSLNKHLVAQGASCLQSMDWRRGNSVITLQDQSMSRNFGEITPIIGWNHWWSYISYKCIIAFSVLGTYIVAMPGTWNADWGPEGPIWPSLVPDTSRLRRRKIPKRSLVVNDLTLRKGGLRHLSFLGKLPQFFCVSEKY